MRSLKFKGVRRLRLGFLSVALLAAFAVAAPPAAAQRKPTRAEKAAIVRAEHAWLTAHGKIGLEAPLGNPLVISTVDHTWAADILLIGGTTVKTFKYATIAQLRLEGHGWTVRRVIRNSKRAACGMPKAVAADLKLSPCPVLAKSAASQASGGCSGAATGSSLAKCVIGHASITGEYAIVAATGRVTSPTSFAVVVYARPAQNVQVAWSMVCTRGTGAGTKSGHFTSATYPPSSSGGKTPTGVHEAWAFKKLAMPMLRPSSCVVSANAQLQSGGWLLVQIIATHA